MHFLLNHCLHDLNRGSAEGSVWVRIFDGGYEVMDASVRAVRAVPAVPSVRAVHVECSA